MATFIVAISSVLLRRMRQRKTPEGGEPGTRIVRRAESGTVPTTSLYLPIGVRQETTNDLPADVGPRRALSTIVV